MQFVQYDQYGHALSHKNPCPWGYEIYNLVDPSLIIIIIY